MSVGLIKRITTNYSLRVPNWDMIGWGREMERNLDIVDAVMFAATGIGSVKGVWANSTAYVIGDRVIDSVDGRIYQCLVGHTSAVSGTFSADRILHPTYWSVTNPDVHSRGQWLPATAYNENEFVSDANRFGITLTNYISGASYNADVAGGKIETLIDMSPYVTNGIGQSIHAAATKATPVDADEFGYADSAASFNLKQMTWAQFGTAMQAKINALAGTTSVGSLNAGSITSGFGTIDIGSDIFTGDYSGIVEQGHICGCEMSLDPGDVTNDVRIDPGECASVLPPYYRMLTTVKQTKRLDAAWAVGDGNGGLDQGSIANATYFVHRIRRPDTFVIDHILSLSHDDVMPMTVTIASPAVITTYNKSGTVIDEHGLVSGSPIKFSTTGALPTGITAGIQYYVQATGLTTTAFRISTSNGGADVNTSGTQSGVHSAVPGPQMPANYTQYRRIGAVIRTGGALVPFNQDGDLFRGPIRTDRNSTAAIASALLTISTPRGIRTKPVIQYALSAGPSTLCVIDLGSAAFGSANTSCMRCNTQAGASDDSTYVIPSVFVTNKQNQIYFAQTNALGTPASSALQTYGWIDTRGRI